MCCKLAYTSYTESQQKSKKRKCDESDTPSVKKFLVNEHACNQEAVTSSIAKYLLKSMRPVSEIENEGFVQLLKALVPSYRPQCRKTMRSTVTAICGKVEARIRNDQ